MQLFRRADDLKRTFDQYAMTHGIYHVTIKLDFIIKQKYSLRPFIQSLKFGSKPKIR